LEADPDDAREIMADDFQEVAEWARSLVPAPDDDGLRARLLRRKKMLAAALGPRFEGKIDTALTSAERQIFRRSFENSETMLGDPVSDIPRANFFVSEDNFAWDMEELVQALQAQGGVMRNPLSRHMFSVDDIGKICGHPLGRCLRPLRQAQDRLRRGFHPTTVAHVAGLGDVMLRDQTENIGPTRRAIDEFNAYVATLPPDEQEAVQSLKIPATDQYTGQPYDLTIGDSVRDVVANVVCSHKVWLACRLGGPCSWCLTSSCRRATFLCKQQDIYSQFHSNKWSDFCT
jgi:hypothetical protein